MKNAAFLITILTVIYGLLLVVVFQYSKTVSDLTQGGISRSEVVEGMMPGGVNTLMVFFGFFIILMLGSWVFYLRKKG